MRPTREDRWLIAWLLLTLAISFVLIGLNAVTARFSGIGYFPREFTPFVFIALNSLITGLWISRRSPRTSVLLTDGGFYGLAVIASAALVTGIQYTPFAPIDSTLARWDAALGYDTVAVLARVAAHPGPRFLLNRIYESTDLLLILAPLPALIRGDRRVMRVYLHAVIYTFLIGSLFYYFFPSSGPASVFSSPDFLPVQRATYMKFVQVHTRAPVTTFLGGMIAFPSFHVAWSVLTSYAARPNRRLFAAAAAWNALVIVSTVVLGWHYAVDVPAGLLLAAAGLYAGAWTHRRLAD
ncbi:MAG: phosphatase PAP2 family protein [Elusimicrobia bacterium]|nr:phosphatase PAP2 family protein [Elusimicrobiota bacterium]